MIEIKHTAAHIEGTNLEILRDTIQLFDFLLEESLELLITCFSSYHKELEYALLNSNPDLLAPLLDLANSMREHEKFIKRTMKGDKTNEK
jgi:hypothetical protein